MASKSKTYNYSDRDLSSAMRQKGHVKARRLERKAEEKAACNPNAKRLEDCVYLKGRGWISIA